MKELAQCDTCGEHLRFYIKPFSSYLVEECPVCDCGEPPRRIFPVTGSEEDYEATALPKKEERKGPKTCAYNRCQKSFIAVRKSQRFCSNRCRNGNHAQIRHPVRVG